MNKEKYSNRRYNKCNLRKKKKNRVMEKEEVATDYKLKQFLDDVQKFTEKSKNTNRLIEKHKKKSKRKPEVKSKPICFKKGLFENGFRSRPCLKVLATENRARLKGNLNDLVKECQESEVDELNTSSSNHSMLHGSYDQGNQEFYSNDMFYGNEQASDDNERYTGKEKQLEPDNNPSALTNQHTDFEKNLDDSLSVRGCQHNPEEVAKAVSAIYSSLDNDDIDPMEIAKQRINNMTYQNFLENARNFPSILKRIFSTDEIRKLAQIAVKDKADKCVQTESSQDCSKCADDYTSNQTCEGNCLLPFPPSLKPLTSSQGLPEKPDFFDLNIPKESNIRSNFLESLENQPDIFSPAGNSSMSCDVTAPPSPTTMSIQHGWAPSTSSAARKLQILVTPTPQSQPITFSHRKKSAVAMDDFSFINRQRRLAPSFRNARRKLKTELPPFEQKVSLEPSLHFRFPKRKKVNFSPHRL